MNQTTWPVWLAALSLILSILALAFGLYTRTFQRAVRLRQQASESALRVAEMERLTSEVWRQISQKNRTDPDSGDVGGDADPDDDDDDDTVYAELRGDGEVIMSLRFKSDTPISAINDRIAEVMEELRQDWHQTSKTPVGDNSSSVPDK